MFVIIVAGDVMAMTDMMTVITTTGVMIVTDAMNTAMMIGANAVFTR